MYTLPASEWVKKLLNNVGNLEFILEPFSGLTLGLLTLYNGTMHAKATVMLPNSALFLMEYSDSF